MNLIIMGPIFGALGMAAFLAIIADPVESQIPDGGIPPTDAWKTIIIDNDATFTQSGQINVNATNYKDELYILTDGSILLNITEHTP